MNICKPTTRVLVVDDHQAHADGLTEQLTLHGFETASASNGKEALELIGIWQPDAVLTDLVLPDMNGYEICSHIRSIPEWDSIAVIFHTAADLHQDLDAQGDAFLIYPVETSQLVTTIEGSIIRRQRKIRTAQTRSTPTR